MKYNLSFGAFIPPFYTPQQNPTVAFDAEIQFIQYIEKNGFTEAWIGEHHSGGHELISSPEIFISRVAALTERIKLGTGVISLPYQHPLMIADKMVLLDHLTKGRSMLGVGPGALVADAYMMGIDPMRSRDIMNDSLIVINDLLHGETVNFQNDFFTLKDARLQLMPWSKEGIEIGVAAVSSDAGTSLAGKLNCSLMSAGKIKNVKHHWDVYSKNLTLKDPDCMRKKWRMTAPLFLAETKEEAIDKTRKGLVQWLKYFQSVTTLKLIDHHTKHEEAVKIINESKYGVIGTYKDAIAFIESLIEASGGFGIFLATKHSWASAQDMINSYSIIADKLIPYFSSMTRSQEESASWIYKNSEEYIEKMNMAISEKSNLQEKNNAHST